MIWDLAGQDNLTHLKTSYLRGVAGYVIVADGTRPFSLNTAISMHKEAREYSGDVPFIVSINKSDLREEQWQVEEEQLKALEESGATIVLTSAKTDDGVEEVFQLLTQNILESESENSLSKDWSVSQILSKVFQSMNITVFDRISDQNYQLLSQSPTWLNQSYDRNINVGETI